MMASHFGPETSREFGNRHLARGVNGNATLTHLLKTGTVFISLRQSQVQNDDGALRLSRTSGRLPS